MTSSGFHLRVTHKIALIGIIGVAGLLMLGGIYLAGEARSDHYRRMADEAVAVRLTANQMMSVSPPHQDFFRMAG
jgi:methyl-accepting chemotaxis protein